jgi:hypothetical protein
LRAAAMPSAALQEQPLPAPPPALGIRDIFLRIAAAFDEILGPLHAPPPALGHDGNPKKRNRASSAPPGKIIGKGGRNTRRYVRTKTRPHDIPIKEET